MRTAHEADIENVTTATRHVDTIVLISAGAGRRCCRARTFWIHPDLAAAWGNAPMDGKNVKFGLETKHQAAQSDEATAGAVGRMILAYLHKKSSKTEQLT